MTLQILTAHHTPSIEALDLPAFSGAVIKTFGKEHQLFHNHPAIDSNIPVYMIEEELFFKQFLFHTTMLWYKVTKQIMIYFNFNAT